MKFQYTAVLWRGDYPDDAIDVIVTATVVTRSDIALVIKDEYGAEIPVSDEERQTLLNLAYNWLAEGEDFAQSATLPSAVRWVVE